MQSSRLTGAVRKFHLVDISHFKLKQVIGRGAFGFVRIVTHKGSGVKYALKYISKSECFKKNLIQNVFRERMILESLDHPYLVNLQYAFQDDRHIFMVLDLETGGDLRYHLSMLGAFSEAAVKLYAAELASAVEYLHTKNIIHRYIQLTQ